MLRGGDGELARAVARGGGIEPLLGALGAGMVIWRGVWREHVPGDDPALAALTRRLRNRRRRPRTRTRSGGFVLQPLARDGELVGALVLPLRHRARGELLALLVVQALRLEEARAEARLANADRRRLKRRLRDATRVQDALFRKAKHDLRTPLATVKGYTDMLHRGMAGPLSPKMKAYLDRIGRAVERQTNLLDQIH